jgi:hypothetical protein
VVHGSVHGAHDEGTEAQDHLRAVGRDDRADRTEDNLKKLIALTQLGKRKE